MAQVQDIALGATKIHKYPKGTIMNKEISKWMEINRFQEYKKPDLYTPLMTDVSNLSEDEKKILEQSVNKSFVNPKFKMKYFVTDAQLTPYHRLRQLFLELKSMEESIENIEFLMKRLPTEMKILKLKQEKVDDIEKAQIELKLLELDRDLNQAKRRVAQHYIERHQYLDLIKEFLDSDESKTPDGRSLLEVFDTPEEDEYESLYWTTRLAKQAAMDILSFGKIMSGNLDAIVTLPPEQQNEVFAIAHRYSMQMESHQLSIKQDIANQFSALENKTNPVNSIENNQEPGRLTDVYRL